MNTSDLADLPEGWTYGYKHDKINVRLEARCPKTQRGGPVVIQSDPIDLTQDAKEFRLAFITAGETLAERVRNRNTNTNLVNLLFPNGGN